MALLLLCCPPPSLPSIQSEVVSKEKSCKVTIFVILFCLRRLQFLFLVVKIMSVQQASINKTFLLLYLFKLATQERLLQSPRPQLCQSWPQTNRGPRCLHTTLSAQPTIFKTGSTVRYFWSSSSQSSLAWSRFPARLHLVSVTIVLWVPAKFIKINILLLFKICTKFRNLTCILYKSRYLIKSSIFSSLNFP